MNPKVGKGNNNQSSGQTTVLNRPLGAPVTPVEPNVGSSDPPLANLQSVVDAAREAVAAQVAAPLQTPAETPQKEFQAQFGSGVTPPVAEVPVAQLDPSIKTVNDLLAKGPQVVESQPEVELPLEVQEFLDSVLSAADRYNASKEENPSASSRQATSF